MSKLETAILLIVEVFDKYAKEEGKKNTLTKSELKNLVDNELPMLLQGAKGKSNGDKLLTDLDENGDSEVDFQEFVIFVTTLTCMVHEKFQTRAQK